MVFTIYLHILLWPVSSKTEISLDILIPYPGSDRFIITGMKKSLLMLNSMVRSRAMNYISRQD